MLSHGHLTFSTSLPSNSEDTLDASSDFVGKIAAELGLQGMQIFCQDSLREIILRFEACGFNIKTVDSGATCDSRH